MRIHTLVAALLVLLLPMGFGSTGVGLAAFYRSSYTTGKEEVVPQPVRASTADGQSVS